MSGFTFAPSALAARVKTHLSKSSASAFCAKMPSSKFSSIVGWAVTLGAPVVAGATVACLYEGSSGNVGIERETGMLASGISTREKAEAGHRKLFYASQPKPLPEGTTISFVPSRRLVRTRSTGRA